MNIGLAELIIILLIIGPLAVVLLLLLLLARRNQSAPTPPLQAVSRPSDREKMQRILDSLERMERRIENLETVVGQQKTEGTDTPLR